MPLFLPGRGFRDGLFGFFFYRRLLHRSLYLRCSRNRYFRNFLFYNLLHRLLYLRYRIDRAAF